MKQHKDKLIKVALTTVGLLTITALFTPLLISSRVAASKALPWLVGAVNTNYLQNFVELLI